MGETGLLWEEFIANCEKQKLDNSLASKVFAYLKKNQYLSQGSRHGTQVELKRILEMAIGDE